MSKLKVVVGTAFGAVVGFVTGVLIAPKSGKETREDIKHAATSAKEKAVEVASDATEKGKEMAHDVAGKADEFKARVEQAAEGAKKGFNKKPRNKK
tara:strand:- start:573 stop:860 length:288 start_codon:yes stop_codon:yes gene_type:complete